MSRIISILISIVLAVSLTGCSKNETKKTNEVPIAETAEENDANSLNSDTEAKEDKITEKNSDSSKNLENEKKEDTEKNSDSQKNKNNKNKDSSNSGKQGNSNGRTEENLNDKIYKKDIKEFTEALKIISEPPGAWLNKLDEYYKQEYKSWTAGEKYQEVIKRTNAGHIIYAGNELEEFKKAFKEAGLKPENDAGDLEYYYCQQFYLWNAGKKYKDIIIRDENQKIIYSENKSVNNSDSDSGKNDTSENEKKPGDNGSNQ